MYRRFDDSWYLRFHGLMPHRVREILLVSSPYDAFTMEEDGRLLTRLFHGYSELNLSELPNLTRAQNAYQAFEVLRERRVDLIITMVNLPDTDIHSFVKATKQEFPDIPVVLFAFTDMDLVSYLGTATKTDVIDQVFLWTGDANVLIAAIKIMEDRRNIDHDTAVGVRVIIVVEDSVRHYSAFLSLLYGELMRQAGSLVAEGINDLHKRMRMRARPKVLLASSYEEALQYYAEYKHNVLAVITDVRYPKDGKENPRAGFELVQRIREDNPELPILVQSAESESAATAAELSVAFGDKNSPHLLRNIRRFLREDLGFGDFIFRMPDKSEVGRARDMYEMERMLPEVPDASIEFHAARNHFSMWLMARGMFMLARELRPRRVEEFEGVEGMRHHLIQVLRRARRQEQMGAISDFSGRRRQDESFLRLGTGSIGGKGRAIAFVNSILRPQRLYDRFESLAIAVPRTLALGTDVFERFLEDNQLHEVVQSSASDEETLSAFLRADLDEELKRSLMIAFGDMIGPVAVRSSSILEDSRQRPFAGIYATHMLPNSDPDPAVRAEQLCRAIKAVYASTYSKNARSYIANTPHAIEEERMGVAIQNVVGRNHGDRFYPDFAGVAYSYNFYPVAGQAADEGIASVALGLGKMVVDGGVSLQFSPKRPRILPQFTSASDYMQFGQNAFYALDRNAAPLDFATDSSVRLHTLDVAEKDGVLAAIGSVYSPEDDTIRDNLMLAGPRVVSFNNILRWESIPLAPALESLLETMRKGFGHAVEIEFAVDLDLGSPDPQPTLFVLQVRPQAESFGGNVPPLPDLPADEFVCRTDVALGHGVIEGIFDLVYVRPDMKEQGGVRLAAQEVGELNQMLLEQRRPYLLVGPGRWGSSDPSLGIGVEWSQICGAKVIVETKFNGRPVEPSQGSHFFHNVLSMQLGYLTLSLLEEQLDGRRAEIDLDWIYAQPTSTEKKTVRHVRLRKPMRVFLDGRQGSGAVLKPE